MLRQPNILLLCGDESQTPSLRDVLSNHARVTSAADLLELKVLLENACFDAVFCAWSFRLGNWRSALHEVQRLNPDLPVIVFSTTGGEREWVDVLDAGGFDLLTDPYRNNTVLPALEQATASYDARLLKRITEQSR